MDPALSVEEETIQSLQHADLIKDLIKSLAELSDREAVILLLRFGFRDSRSYTYEEIGKEFNLTEGGIRRIEAKALSKLRYRHINPKSASGSASTL